MFSIHILAASEGFRQNIGEPIECPSMNSSPVSTPRLFTIGHSSLELEDFLAVLARHEIGMVCDVRSRPGSFRFPQFNREPLEAGLRAANRKYEFLGETLGGRPSDLRVYQCDGVVDYALRRKAPDFLAGIEHTIENSRSQKIILMCAEEDPLQCHRFLMICPALLERGITPLHIRRGGVLESQGEAEDRLLALNDLSAFTSDSLFVSERGPALEEALRRQAQEYAFRGSPEQVEDF
jgi:uncharacterized protein (DUF488 family)